MTNKLDFTQKINAEMKPTKATLGQCAKDWWRNRESYYVNGKNVADLMLTEFGEGYDTGTKAEIFKSNDSFLIQEFLTRLWTKEFGKEYLDVFSGYAHQGGFQHNTQVTLFREALNQNLFVGSTEVDSKVDFDKKTGYIEVREGFRVNKIRDAVSGDLVAEGHPVLSSMTVVKVAPAYMTTVNVKMNVHQDLGKTCLRQVGDAIMKMINAVIDVVEKLYFAFFEIADAVLDKAAISIAGASSPGQKARVAKFLEDFEDEDLSPRPKR